MAQVILTFRIMPKSPEEDLSRIEAESQKLIEAFGGKFDRVERQPIAFGLVAVQPTFRVEEAKGDTEALEQQIAAMPGVSGVEVIGCSRAVN